MVGRSNLTIRWRGHPGRGAGRETDVGTSSALDAHTTDAHNIIGRGSAPRSVTATTELGIGGRRGHHRRRNGHVRTIRRGLLTAPAPVVANEWPDGVAGIVGESLDRVCHRQEAGRRIIAGTRRIVQRDSVVSLVVPRPSSIFSERQKLRGPSLRVRQIDRPVNRARCWWVVLGISSHQGVGSKGHQGRVRVQAVCGRSVRRRRSGSRSLSAMITGAIA